MKIRIFNADDQEVAVIRAGQVNRIESINVPASHPWPDALADEIEPGKSRLYIPDLDTQGYWCEVVEVPPPPPMPLEELKAGALAQVNEWRMREEEAGFTYDGKPYQSDSRSAQRIQGGLQIAQLQEAANPGSYAQDWKASDNTMSTLDHAGIVGLMTAMGTHIATVFAQSEAAKAAIGAADDDDAVHAVVANLQSN